MLIKLKLDRDNLGKPKSPVSAYNPKESVKRVTGLVMKNWQTADAVKNKPYREFNDMTLLQRQSLDQMRFNSYQEPMPNDADEAWKSRAIRPITRNRAISIAAHLTAAVLHPIIHAQNENDEEDRDAAHVMRDLVEWAGEQSGYEQTMVYAIIAALVNPGVILHTEFCEVYRKVKDWVQDYSEGRKPSKYEVKEVLDELYSGFQDSIVPLDEIWLPDFYQRNIQKQPYIIRRRTITYDLAQFKYGDEPNIKFVNPGEQHMFIDGDHQGQFYAVQDEELQGQLCEEVIYYDRGRDLQLTFLNGVLMCDPEYPNPRLDKKYPFEMFGFEPISERFAWYKSVVNKMGTDEDVIQTLYRMIIDGTYLQLMPPQAVYGEEGVTSAVMVPGASTHFKDTNAKIEALKTGANLDAGLQVLQKVESSASESSIDPVLMGQSSASGSKQPSTAYEISQQIQNARSMLGLFGKMIGFAVKAFGELRISDILQYLTVADVSEITSGLKYQTFLLPDRSADGQTVSDRIEFDLSLPDQMTRGMEKEMSFDLYDQEEQMGGKVRIFKVNPTAFRKIKFKVKVVPDTITPPSDAVKRALNLEEFDRLIQLPFVDQEAVTRDLLLSSYSRTKDDPDRYLRQQQPNLAAVLGAGQMAGPPNLGQPGSMAGERANRFNQRRMETSGEVVRAGY